ncbi:TPA: ead/Ea22-like family protein [Escherichia coli]|nr:ead/Ea22-like family protein [Escherichia coli]HEA8601773.1 ead/Ea22-like family protein [Escherichia coli]
MSEINYQALREAAQNYQSMLAWYQENPDSPNAERDCDEALAAFKREIRHRELDIIADLLGELEEAKQRIDEQESRTVKLPEPFKLAKSSSGLTYYYADEVNAALTSAGIRIEGE